MITTKEYPERIISQMIKELQTQFNGEFQDRSLTCRENELSKKSTAMIKSLAQRCGGGSGWCLVLRRLCLRSPPSPLPLSRRVGWQGHRRPGGRAAGASPYSRMLGISVP